MLRIPLRPALVLTLLLSGVLGHAQLPQSEMACHTTPKTKQERQSLSRQFLEWKSRRTSDTITNEIRYVPVVFHVLASTSPSTQVFDNALTQLNDAFANEGSFATEEGIDTKIRFCRAQTTPDGGRTAGINHVPSAYKDHDVDLETDEVYRRTYWDTTRYLNIYLVDVINGESSAVYSGRDFWRRQGVGGYATNWGIAVTSLSGALLAHECGHYFGLLHTWQGQDCKNDDCLVDGDMVCDTPPDRSLSEPCGDNSCQTDTLSNFSNGFFMTDTLDMSTNIMDYSPCPTDFTFGQAERMHFTLDESYPSLATTSAEGPLCDAPCSADILATFEIGNEYPTPGESTSFTGEVVSSDSIFDFRWYVSQASEMWTAPDTSDLVGTSEDMSFTFSEEGVYRVTLHVRTASGPECYASFSANVIVSCGVDARFYPDKRVIASKQPHALFTDSVTFTNRSHGATSWEWTVTHENFDSDNSSLPVANSSEENLTYYFREPGTYEITLTARDGACEDVSNTFSLPVIDPTIDGAPSISEVFCSGDDLLVSFNIFNLGYDTINAGTPVAFYSEDPTRSGEARLLGAMDLPRLVYGLEREEFTARLPNSVVTLPELFIVFNDTGTVQLPIVFPPGDQNRLSSETEFPPSGYSELSYGNNVASFAIEVALEANVSACEGDEILLDSRELFGPIWCWDSLSWVSEAQGFLGSANSLEYLAEEDDLIEVTFHHDSAVTSMGRINVMINEPSEVVVVPDTVYRISKGESTRLNVSFVEGYSYEWTPTEDLEDPFAASPIASPEENTLYRVEVTDGDGCTADFDIQVWVETTAYIPNLFTPNSDGANDVLLAYGLEGVLEISFRVFNRNGAEVFASDVASILSNSGWDGSSGGSPQPTGSYFWEVQGAYQDGRSVTFNGTNSGVIHLVR